MFCEAALPSDLETMRDWLARNKESNRPKLCKESKYRTLDGTVLIIDNNTKTSAVISKLRMFGMTNYNHEKRAPLTYTYTPRALETECKLWDEFITRTSHDQRQFFGGQEEDVR